MPVAKTCPRCRGPLSCNAEDVSNCACSAIRLSAEQQAAIGRRWTDCLCPSCLGELQQREAEEIDGGE